MTPKSASQKPKSPGLWLARLTGARPFDPGALAGLDDAAWDAIRAGAVRSRLAALVAAQIAAHGWEAGVPPAICAALRQEQRRTLVACTQQAYALRRLTAALHAAGIDFRVLKGLALAAQAYPAPTARSVGDLDLWVRPAAVERAAAVLGDLGLAPIPDPHGRAPAFLRAYGEEREFAARPTSPPAPPCTGEGSPPPPIPAAVDLHWHLVAPWWMRATLAVPDAAIFARAQPVVIAGQAYQALDPTDHLYYLCLHAGLGHQFRGLRLLIDLVFLARAPGIDWPRLRALAVQSGAGVIVWRGLALAGIVAGEPLAARLGWQPARWQRRLVRRVLPGAVAEAGGATGGEVGLPLEHLALLPGPRAVAGALGRLLWPPADWVRLRYAALGPGRPTARLHHLARLRHLWP